MNWTGIFGTVAAGGLVFAGIALAAEQSGPLPGKIHVVKGAKLAKLVSKSKPIDPDTFDLPNSGTGEDPTIVGATLIFADLGLAAGSVAYNLDKTGWTALGSPPGAKGYKYKGKNDVVDPNPKGDCPIVLIKDKVIKAVCKGANVTLSTPYAGIMAANLGIPGGSSAIEYCWEFGGTNKKNTSVITKRKDAAAPGSCVALN